MKPLIPVIVCFLVFFSCGQLSSPLTGGSASEGEAKVFGKVVYSGSGFPAANAEVILRPADFLKDTSRYPVNNSFARTIDLFTDKNGNFVIDSVDTGSYTLEINDKQSSAVLMRFHNTGDSSDIELPLDSLRPTGTISGTCPSSGSAAGNAFVRVYGLDRLAKIDFATGTFTVPDVPRGLYSLQIVSSSPAFPPKTIGGVAVVSGDTAVVPFGEWKFFRRLYLNTTATSGAGVTGNLRNFPVLVRLTDSDFNFTETQADGSDLLMTKSDNSPVPFKIQRWDPVAGRAEIWVKIDTVYGNNDKQHIIMYWGAPAGGTGSNGPVVFDSTTGFEGVWHLDETSGTRANDASYNGFPGSYKGGLPRNANGPFGLCQTIVQPDSDYVDMGNVLNPGLKNISVGVWVKRAAFGTQQALVAKTNGDAPSKSYGFLFSIDLFNFPHFYIASGGAAFGDDGVFDVTSSLTITDSAAWHYVFVSVDRSDNSRCKMFLDGVDRTGTLRGDVSSVANIANALRLRIGTENDNNYSYKGAIAEATIAFIARSADWVKLSYMNQKERDALVKW